MQRAHPWLLPLSLLAAALYNIWPLGYVLNKPVAQHGVVSVLGALHQPYSWLFILGDVLFGLCLIIMAGLPGIRPQNRSIPLHRALLWTGLLLFGIFTLVSALLPLDCSRIPIDLCSDDSTQIFDLHNITGGIADFGLFLTLLGSALRARSRINRALLVVWALNGSLILALAPLGANSIREWIQRVFLILGGIALVAAMPRPEIVDAYNQSAPSKS